MGPKKEEDGPTKVFRGIYRNMGCYRARIWTPGGECYLGHYESDKDAASAFDRAAIHLRGWAEANKDGLNIPEKWLGLKADPPDQAVQQELDALQPETIAFGELVDMLKREGFSKMSGATYNGLKEKLEPGVFLDSLGVPLRESLREG